MTPKKDATKRDVVLVAPLGGSGTRFYPATLETPKQLVPIANHPIFGASAYHWIEEGARDLVFGVTGYNNRVQTRRFFGNGGRYSNLANVRIYYTNYDDREFQKKGSADVFMWALDEYKQMMGDRHVLLVNGDNLSNTSLDDFYQSHRDSKALMTMAVKSLQYNDPRLRGFGTVSFDGKRRVEGFEEKSENPFSNYVNTAICLFSPEIHDLLNSKDFLEKLDEKRSGGRLDVGSHFIPALLGYRAPVYAYILKGPWTDIGTFVSFTETTNDILHGKYPNIRYPEYERVDDVLVHKETRHRMGKRLEDVTFEGPCIVGRSSTIGKGTTVRNSVVGDNVVVGKNVVIDEVTTLLPFSRVESGARVANAIVGQNTTVGKDAVVEAGAFLGDDLHIPEGMRIGVDCRVAKMHYYNDVMNARIRGLPMYEALETFGDIGAFTFREKPFSD